MPDPNHIVSHEHRVVLMLPAKCANSSIKLATLTALGRPWTSANGDGVHNDRVFDTISPCECRALKRRGYLVAGAIRNPICRTISAWRDKIASRRQLTPGLMKMGARPGMDFQTFVQFIAAKKDRDADIHVRSQTYDVAPGGDAIPDVWLCVERLSRDWESLCRRAGWRHVRLPRATVSTRHSVVVSASDRQRILRRYADDHALWRTVTNGCRISP